MNSTNQIMKLLGIDGENPIIGTVRRYGEGHEQAPARPGSPVWQAAGYLLGQLSRMTETVTRDDVFAWMAPILACVKAGSLSAEDVENRVNGIAFALEGTPRFLLCEDLQREIIRKCEWMPTPAEIWAFVEPMNGAYHIIASGLKRMVGMSILDAFPDREAVMLNGWDKPAEISSPTRIRIAASNQTAVSV